MDRQTLVIGAVAGHLSLTLLHGIVHAAIPIVPSGWTAAVATVALSLMPVAGAVLVWRGHPRIGSVLLGSAGIASLAFEGAFHFLLDNPDHVAQVPEHHASFVVTAILTIMGDLLLIVAAWGAVRERIL